jgi:hypothetical protein
MDELADRYEAAELNRSGFRLYRKFRPAVRYGNEGFLVPFACSRSARVIAASGNLLRDRRSVASGHFVARQRYHSARLLAAQQPP